MGTLRRYVIQRLVASGLTLLGVSCIIFVLVRLLPGDPARVIAGLLASEDEVTSVRRQLGLDRALYVQYGHFLARVGRGDLGLSARTSEPVVREIMGLHLCRSQSAAAFDARQLSSECAAPKVRSSRYPSRKASVGSTLTARRAGPAADNRPMVMMKMAAAGRIPGMCHPPSTSMFSLR